MAAFQVFLYGRFWVITEVDGPLSPVPFKGKTCRIAAVFNDSCSKAALFLCNPDCVAERVRFEPSLPFASAR